MKPSNFITIDEFKKMSKQYDLSNLFYAEINRHKKNLLFGIEREFRFHKKRMWRFDLAWPDYNVAVEIDGGQFKKFGGRHARDSDREKMNNAVILGWAVLRFSGEMIKKDPVLYIDQLNTLIENKKLMYKSD